MPVIWLVLWYGLGSMLLFFAVAGLPILDLQQGAIHSVSALLVPAFAPGVINLTWLWAWFAMHAQGWVRRSFGFYPGWFAVQGLAWALWPRIFKASMRPYIRRIYLFTAVLGVTLLLYGFVVSSVLVPLFNSSGDVGRILVRLVALTIVTEIASAVFRVTIHKLMSPAVPGAVRGALVMSLSMFESFAGRLFTTGMSSFTLTMALSIVGAIVEGIVRRTNVKRFEWYLVLFARVERSRSCCCARRKPGTAEAERGGTQLGTAQDHATRQRANATFLLGETMSSDIGMLTLIPVAIFFRLPTRIGGQPLPLGDVLLRVGFQWLLELATDLSPFFLYAGGRAWLQWQGDTLYGPICAEAVRTAFSEVYAQSEAAAETLPASTPHGHANAEASMKGCTMVQPVTQMGAKYSSGASLLDDSSPAGTPARSLGDPQNTVARGSSCVGATAIAVDSTVSQSPPTARGTDQAGRLQSQPALFAPSLSPLQVNSSAERVGEHEPYQGMHCCNLLFIADGVDAAVAESKRRLEPLLADDADVLWQRLPWRAVRRAMAPDAAEGEWSWLHWFTYRSELLAARLSTAWSRRQPGFLVLVLVYAVTLHGFVMRTNLGTSAACPRLDEAGERFFDACRS